MDLVLAIIKNNVKKRVARLLSDASGGCTRWVDAKRLRRWLAGLVWHIDRREAPRSFLLLSPLVSAPSSFCPPSPIDLSLGVSGIFFSLSFAQHVQEKKTNYTPGWGVCSLIITSHSLNYYYYYYYTYCSLSPFNNIPTYLLRVCLNTYHHQPLPPTPSVWDPLPLFTTHFVLEHC